MSPPEDDQIAARIRREPPRFRTLEVRRVEPITPWMVRVTLGGPELDGLVVDEPAASVRLLLPARATRELVMPVWNGNEFLFDDGSRPAIRTLTPYRVDAAARELEVWIVLHDGGAASAWVSAAEAGDPVAISGPGRGYTIDRDAPGFLVAGDETAIAAISQLLEVLPPQTPTQVIVEVAHPDARLALPDHPGASMAWLDLPPGASPGDALVEAVMSADIPAEARIWVAGEAAAVQRIRKHLFDERGFVRAQTTVRGYWKRAQR